MLRTWDRQLPNHRPAPRRRLLPRRLRLLPVALPLRPRALILTAAVIPFILAAIAAGVAICRCRAGLLLLGCRLLQQLQRALGLRGMRAGLPWESAQA